MAQHSGGTDMWSRPGQVWKDLVIKGGGSHCWAQPTGGLCPHTCTRDKAVAAVDCLLLTKHRWGGTDKGHGYAQEQEHPHLPLVDQIFPDPAGLGLPPCESPLLS